MCPHWAQVFNGEDHQLVSPHPPCTIRPSAMGAKMYNTWITSLVLQLCLYTVYIYIYRYLYWLILTHFPMATKENLVWVDWLLIHVSILQNIGFVERATPTKVIWPNGTKMDREHQRESKSPPHWSTHESGPEWCNGFIFRVERR